MALQLKTLTVAQLIAALLHVEDKEMPVIFACDYGDRSHTEQALAITGEIEEVCIKRSGYSASGFKTVTLDEVADGVIEDLESEQQYVVIR